MSELIALGISHKTAPVAMRERLAFTMFPAGLKIRLEARSGQGAKARSSSSISEPT